MTLYGMKGGRMIMKRTLTSIPDIVANIPMPCYICVCLKKKYNNDSRYRTTYEDKEYRVMYPFQKWPLELHHLLKDIDDTGKDGGKF